MLKPGIFQKIKEIADIKKFKIDYEQRDKTNWLDRKVSKLAQIEFYVFYDFLG